MKTVYSLSVFIAWWALSLSLYLSASFDIWSKISLFGIKSEFSIIIDFSIASLFILTAGAYPSIRGYNKAVWALAIGYIAFTLLTFISYGPLGMLFGLASVGPLGILFGLLGLKLARKAGQPGKLPKK